MRLTLRTLLAYLDRILDPADAEELRHKVDESERASALIQRIERLLHERSTEAIDIYAKGHGADANSVAEYLDNQMQPEHVAEFERVCLESDSHLAETAACHQILTKVLGQKAEVASALRQRLYDLPAQEANDTTGPRDGVAVELPGRHLRWDPPAVPAETQRQPAEVAAEVVRAAAVPATPVARPAAQQTPAKASKPTWDADERWTTAPDYLKRPRRGWWQPWAIGLAILLLLAIAGLRGMGPLDATHPLAKSFGLEKYLPQGAVVARNDSSSGDAALQKDKDPSNASTDAAGDRDSNAEAAAALLNAEPSSRGSDSTADDTAATTNDEPADTDNAVAGGGEGEEAGNALAADLDGSARDPNAEAGADAESSPSGDKQPIENEGGTNIAASEDPAAEDATESDDSTSLNNPASVASREEGDPAATEDATIADANTPTQESADATESADESPSAPEPPDLINPLDSVATNQNEPVELVPALPGRNPVPDDVSDPGALGAAEGQTPEASASTEKPTVADVGRFLNEQQVLVRFDPASETWVRMPAGTALAVGQRLLSFPTFRPPIVLASGMQVTLIGASEMAVMPPAADQTPVFQLRYGRAAVATFTSAGTRLGIQWGQGRTGTVTMDDMTTLAFEVQQSYLPGADPAVAENQAHDLLFVYVMSGNAQWTSATGETLSLSPGKRMAMVDDRGPHLSDVSDLPLWIDGRDARPRDPIAAQDLSKRLTVDRPVDLVLSELSVEKRVEQRSLALCCLAYLGQLDPLLTGFADEKLRAYWPMQYEVLVHLMNQGPESVTRLKSALIQHHGDEDGQLMFEMLLGYTPQQLQDGSAEAMVDNLNHPSTSVRFIANQTLRAVSGLPTLYQAHGNERSRRTAVAKWRTHLQQGKIAYVTAPELVQLLNEAKPAATP